MTNVMIIMAEQVKLADEGILKYTGRILKGVTPAGEEVEYPEIQQIHTYNGWKARGYQVKKGQKAITKFPIWKYTKGKKKDMDEEEAQAKGYCFMKNSAWFTEEQVEPIKKEAKYVRHDNVSIIDDEDTGSVYDVNSANFDEELYDREQA